jgi:2-oxo-3-hexenedioate decarboxylase
VLTAADAVFVAVDILDSRSENFRVHHAGRRCGQRQRRGFILGPRAASPTALDDLHLRGCVLRVDGDIVATAAGGAVMGHPAASVAWLANQLATREQYLRAGWLVFSGGLTEPIPLTPGVAVSTEIAGLGLIEVHAR